jgi:hypothetical protein
MTLHVTRDGAKVTIHGNTGLRVAMRESRVTEFAITEDTAHLRSFWGQLGRALDEAEHHGHDHAAEDESAQAQEDRAHATAEERAEGAGGEGLAP